MLLSGYDIVVAGSTGQLFKCGREVGGGGVYLLHLARGFGTSLYLAIEVGTIKRLLTL